MFRLNKARGDKKPLSMPDTPVTINEVLAQSNRFGISICFAEVKLTDFQSCYTNLNKNNDLYLFLHDHFHKSKKRISTAKIVYGT